MNNRKNKCYIGQNGKLVLVSDEVRKAINKEVGYIRYRARIREECVASLKGSARCDGDCESCFHHVSKTASVEARNEQCNTQIADRYGEQEFRVVEITADVARIDKDGETICRMILLKYSPSEIAAYLGISRDTYYHRLRNIARLLRWDE